MEGYSSLSREKLIEKIEELKRLNKQLLEENEQETRLDFSWSGNLGHWYWDIPSNLSGKADVYEAEYRIRAKDGRYKWYNDRGRITQYNENGKPVFLAGIVFDISDSKELQLQLEKKNRILAEQSSIDVLTKVKNRRAFMSSLEEEVEGARKSKKPLSLALFDIDDFKKLNDNYGHLYGDRVLFEVAAIMQKNIREDDVLGRYGGEEFMVLFRNADPEKARSVSERVREAVAAFSFKGNVRVTVSGGISAYQDTPVDEFINTADMNLYIAKRNGKNQIR